jgi:hypothetical protein
MHTMEWLSKILDVIKLPIRYVVCIASVTAILLFFPEPWLIKLHLKEFATRFGLFIGIVFVGSSTLVAVHAACAGIDWIKRVRRHHRIKEKIDSTLSNLDPKEQAVLREFFLHGQKTLRLPIDHPVVAGLLDNGVLALVGKFGERSRAGQLFSVQLNAYVDTHLTADMIELPEGEPTEDQIRRLMESRPDFMPALEYHEDLFHRPGTPLLTEKGISPQTPLC